ncbi:MAG: Gfo/Idh/MocA family oxidoreductase [Oscillospiraceae bacterium]|nr:Gfo/Idh/MocA family oxidoreductase [Oscillospiraceae bacterium]
MDKINIAVVGLGFGGGFAGLYKYHPNVASVGICDLDAAKARQTADTFGINKIYGDYDEVLSDRALDAVHLVTPIPLHEEQTVMALKAGKHCACTVPMALSLAGLQRITGAVRKTGKRFMMMETTLYTYQFFYIQNMIKSGEMGRIQFMRGSHYQDMRNWPDYWIGLPPMHYATHAIAPMVALSGSRISRVHCFGSGVIENPQQPKDNKARAASFPVECAIFDFENGMKAEATRSLFETARTYQEGLFVYGSKASFEWGFADGDDPYVTTAFPPEEGRRGGTDSVKRVKMPEYLEYIPKELWPHARSGAHFDPQNPQESMKKGFGSGHHGSHPHLVHEFVTSVIEDRRPHIDEVLAANITAAGICAHESALRSGEAVTVPVF